MANAGTPIILSAAVLLTLGAAAPLPLQAQDGIAARAAMRGSSQEVTAFLRRRASCNRLTGDAGDDPDRTAEAVKSRFWLKCSTLDDDERRLRARYADRPSVIDALDQSGDLDNGNE